MYVTVESFNRLLVTVRLFAVNMIGLIHRSGAKHLVAFTFAVPNTYAQDCLLRKKVNQLGLFFCSVM